MKKSAIFKKIILASASSLLLTACGTNTDSENEESTTDPPMEDHQSDENETTDETNSTENEEKNETEEQDQEIDNELTEEEAIENVLSYLEEQEGMETEGLRLNTTERKEAFRVQVFAFVPEDEEEQMTQTLGWFLVDKESGEVTKTDAAGKPEEERSGELSEIVYMNAEEREAHHREVAAAEEHLQSSVLENLMLPGIHENTIYYEGRINPGDNLIVYLVDPKDPIPADRIDTQPEVDEDGYFSIELNRITLESNNNFRISISGAYPQEQVFDLPIHEAQEGMESIHVKE